MTVGLGKGLQLSGSLPVDWRRVDIDAQLDGEPYEPVYTDRSEWQSAVFGISDARVSGDGAGSRLRSARS